MITIDAQDLVEMSDCRFAIVGREDELGMAALSFYDGVFIGFPLPATGSTLSIVVRRTSVRGFLLTLTFAYVNSLAAPKPRARLDVALLSQALGRALSLLKRVEWRDGGRVRWRWRTSEWWGFAPSIRLGDG